MNKNTNEAPEYVYSLPEAFCGAAAFTMGVNNIIVGVKTLSVKRIISGVTLTAGGALSLIHSGYAILDQDHETHVIHMEETRNILEQNEANINTMYRANVK